MENLNQEELSRSQQKDQQIDSIQNVKQQLEALIHDSDAGLSEDINNTPLSNINQLVSDQLDTIKDQQKQDQAEAAAQVAQLHQALDLANIVKDEESVDLLNSLLNNMDQDKTLP